MMKQIAFFIMIMGMMTIPQISSAAERSYASALPSAKSFSPYIDNLPKWERIIDFYDMANLQNPSAEYKRWWQFIRQARQLPPVEQIEYVNKTLNQFPYKQDNWVYNRDDHWATPSEFLKNGGDCEDYAIIKYMTLRRLGFDANQMKIAVVYDVYSGTDHAYLVVNFGNQNFILDSREEETNPSAFTKRYQAHYAFNEEGIWQYPTPRIVQKHRAPNSTEAIPGNR
jgi:predicted transglutaminase-like cysteine proteinase